MSWFALDSSLSPVYLVLAAARPISLAFAQLSFQANADARLYDNLALTIDRLWSV